MTSGTAFHMMQAVLLALLFGAAATDTSAQYMGNMSCGEDGSCVLEETIGKGLLRADQPTGLEALYLEGGGSAWILIVAGVVFGAAAGALFIKGRSGRYREPGMG